MKWKKDEYLPMTGKTWETRSKITKLNNYYKESVARDRKNRHKR